MKLNKLAMVVALALGAVSGVQAADQGKGIVRFTGSIIEAPCSIDPDSIDQTVPLGAVSNLTLADGGNSIPQPFEVRLEKCTMTTVKTVKTTFNGSAGTAGMLGITGDAAGAGIVLTDGSGTPIVLGTATAGQLISVGATEATLAFSAYLKGNGGDIESITPGEFSSVVNFMLTYI
ncbi:MULTISPECIES: fimbrial protein [unclassified Pseudomonas]|uniref:fimbrial protein n=1 Tax=unclassified Pseudomonas TaxID=196821 RepID=UPI000996B135|nr:fimbrial protein [Pseudomonas sp. MF4836]OOV89393.1 fimbria A protein [Pseudomonas sp. MF4836]